MLSHPAFLPALVGRYAQRKALLAEQNISAVCGIDGYDRVVLREVANIALFGVNVAFCVKSANPVVAVAEHVKHFLSDACHYAHVEYDVD